MPRPQNYILQLNSCSDFLGSLQHLEENNFSLTWITHCPLLNLPARRIRSLKKIFKAVFVVNKVVSFSILKNWYLHYHFGKFPLCNCTWPILKILLKVLQKNEIPLEQQTFTSMKYHYDYDKINLSYCQIPRPNTSKKYIFYDQMFSSPFLLHSPFPSSKRLLKPNAFLPSLSCWICSSNGQPVLNGRSMEIMVYFRLCIMMGVERLPLI